MVNKTRRPNQSERRSLTERVMSLSRYARLAIVFGGVLVMAFALQQVVGELYTRVFTTSGAMSTVSWIVAAICLSMYFAGYIYIIGMPGVTPPAGRAQTIYLLVIAVLTTISVIWMIVRAAGALSE